MQNPIKVSLFIPVFNGENYLEKTLLSIKNQSYKNFEVIIVNNASDDLSNEIILKFVNQDPRFILINYFNTNSVAKTWNLTLPILKGDFIFYASQDDLFSSELIQKMVQRQEETKAEIVLPDMEYYYENIVDNIRIVGLNYNREIILNGKQAFLESLDWNIHGFALFKKNLFDNEVFPEDAFDSDEYITRKLFFKSKQVAFSEGIFFYRQDNENAITKKVDESVFYALNTLLKLYFFIKDNHFDKLLVLQYQYKLQKKYFDFIVLSADFVFKNDHTQSKVLIYLREFKSQNLLNFGIISNLVILRRRFYLKYFFMNLIFKFEFLFNIAVRIKLLQSKCKT